jgi:hypothetical protein
MYRCETDSDREVLERLGPGDRFINERVSYDERYDGPPLLSVSEEQSHRFPQVCNIRSGDHELSYRENKLGCARGVIWAFAFEAAMLIVIAICWKLHFFLR